MQTESNHVPIWYLEFSSGSSACLANKLLIMRFQAPLYLCFCLLILFENWIYLSTSIIAFYVHSYIFFLSPSHCFALPWRISFCLLLVASIRYKSWFPISLINLVYICTYIPKDSDRYQSHHLSNPARQKSVILTCKVDLCPRSVYYKSTTEECVTALSIRYPHCKEQNAFQNRARQQHELAMENLRRKRLVKIDRMYCLLETRLYLSNWLIYCYQWHKYACMHADPRLKSRAQRTDGQICTVCRLQRRG